MDPSKTKAKPRRKLAVGVDAVLDALEARYGRSRFISRFAPMEELVSCILSQHTADVNSFPAFTRLREKYPEWQDVVDAGTVELAVVIRKAGLANQKAKSIIKTLTEIKSRNGEYAIDHLRKLPMKDARDWLESLPGVGPKTASIVLCFSFGMGAIPVDTHVFRVSRRLGVLPEMSNEKKAHDQLLEIVAPEDAFRYHTALIQHGRHVCKAPIPICEDCPLMDQCPWFKKVGPERERARLKKKRAAK